MLCQSHRPRHWLLSLISVVGCVIAVFIIVTYSPPSLSVSSSIHNRHQQSGKSDRSIHDHHQQSGKSDRSIHDHHQQSDTSDRSLHDHHQQSDTSDFVFVKESTDLFSSEGDDSDYLFPPCLQRTRQSRKAAELLETTVNKTDPKFGFVGPFPYLANYKNPCWVEHNPRSEKPTRAITYCVPYFYLVGAPKAGSTDLFHRIALHPDVIKPMVKETRWFDRARFSGSPHFSSFLKNFIRASGVIARSSKRGNNYHNRILGDGSPSHFFDNRKWKMVPGNEGCSEPRVTVASHIHHLFPEARILFLLRNPTDRLYSSYLFNHAKYETVSKEGFHVRVTEAVRLYKDCFAKHSVRQCANDAALFKKAKVILSVGLYSVFVQDWLKLFPRDRILVVFTERYTLNMGDHLSKIFRFLGLRKLSAKEMAAITEQRRWNRGKHYSSAGPMLPETRTMLEEFYRPFNQQLAVMLNDSLLWTV